MRNLFMLLFFIFTLQACKNNSSKSQSQSQSQIITLIKDSTSIFHYLGNNHVKDSILQNGYVFYFEGVKEKEFYEAMERNTDNVHWFTKERKINEKDACKRRIKGKLKVGIKEPFITFNDVLETDSSYSERYFLKDIVGKYFIIQKMHFELVQTLLLNSETNNIDFIVNSISTSSRDSDSLFFYSKLTRYDLSDQRPISLLKLNANSVDTILYANTNWSAPFSFFDNKSDRLYYIHSEYDDGVLIRRMAKMRWEKY